MSSESEQESNQGSGWVLVTGGSRGIGRGLVQHFDQAGYDVAFTYLSNEAAAIEVCDAATGSVTRHQCDGKSLEQLVTLSDELIASNGAPTGIIVNAGITRDMPFVKMGADDWTSVIDTNLNSVYNTLKPFVVPMMENGGGSIVLMSSIAGQKGNPGQANYSATKAGMIGLARTLATELGRFGIRVNVVAPGYIETDMTDEVLDRDLKKLKKMIPLRRIGQVEEVANLCDFLVSDKSAYMTGQTLTLDGGFTS